MGENPENPWVPSETPEYKCIGKGYGTLFSMSREILPAIGASFK